VDQLNLILFYLSFFKEKQMKFEKSNKIKTLAWYLLNIIFDEITLVILLNLQSVIFVKIVIMLNLPSIQTYTK